jgi:hypothetical protein
MQRIAPSACRTPSTELSLQHCRALSGTLSLPSAARPFYEGTAFWSSARLYDGQIAKIPVNQNSRFDILETGKTG